MIPPRRTPMARRESNALWEHLISAFSGYALVRGGRPALTHRAEIPFIHRSWQVMNACTPPLPGCGAEQDDGAVMRMVGCVGVPRGHFDGGEGDTALEALSRVTPNGGNLSDGGTNTLTITDRKLSESFTERDDGREPKK